MDFTYSIGGMAAIHSLVRPEWWHATSCLVCGELSSVLGSSKPKDWPEHASSGTPALACWAGSYRPYKLTAHGSAQL